MKTIKNSALAAIVITFCLLLQSCIKDNTKTLNQAGNYSKNRTTIPYYDSEDEATDELMHRLDMLDLGLDVLVDYEEQNGYASLGRVSNTLIA